MIDTQRENIRTSIYNSAFSFKTHLYECFIMFTIQQYNNTGLSPMKNVYINNAFLKKHFQYHFIKNTQPTFWKQPCKEKDWMWSMRLLHAHYSPVLCPTQPLTLKLSYLLKYAPYILNLFRFLCLCSSSWHCQKNTPLILYLTFVSPEILNSVISSCSKLPTAMYHQVRCFWINSGHSSIIATVVISACISCCGQILS